MGVGVSDPAERYFKDGVWGEYGGAWIPLKLVWAYTDRFAQADSELDSPGGAVDIDLTAVPAGEVWKIEGISARDQDSAITSIFFTLRYSGGGHHVFVQPSPVLGLWDAWTGMLTLKATDYVRVTFNGTVLHDRLYARAWGYKMDIT